MSTPRTVTLDSTDPTLGCVRCGTQRTVQLHPYHGRLCSRHAVLPTLPAGGYRRELALHMVDLGRADAAFAYLAGWLAHEIGIRFALAVGALGGAA